MHLSLIRAASKLLKAVSRMRFFFMDLEARIIFRNQSRIKRIATKKLQVFSVVTFYREQVQYFLLKSRELVHIALLDFEILDPRSAISRSLFEPESPVKTNGGVHEGPIYSK